MWKKVTALLLAVLMLAGCTGGGGNSSADSSKADSSPSAANSQGSKEEESLPENLAVLNEDAAYPVVNTPITLTLMGARKGSQGEWKDLKFFQKWQELTGITLDIDAVLSDNWDTQKNLAFASQNLPDVFYAGSFKTSEELDYGDDQKMLLDISALIDQYCPNLTGVLEQKPEVRSSITTPSGAIYCLPYINDMDRDLTTKYWINQKWIEALGKQVPTTADELYEILLAFRDNDMNGNGDTTDEIPLSWPKGIETFYKTTAWFGAAFDTSTMLGYDDDGKVYYGPFTDSFKQTIQWYINAWNDGLLDNEIFEQDSSQFKAKGQNDTLILGAFMSAGPYVTVPKEYNEDYIAIPALKASNGKQEWFASSGLKRGTFAITNVCKYPEAALRMVDWVYGKEGALYQMRGEAGVDFVYQDAEEKTCVVQWPEGYDNFETYRAKVITPNAGSSTPGIGAGTLPQVVNPLNDWINLQVETQLKPYWKLAFPDVYLTPENTEKAASIQADLKSYLEIAVGELITGKRDLESSWDEVISELEKMGAQEYIDIYQEAFNAWANK